MSSQRACWSFSNWWSNFSYLASGLHASPVHPVLTTAPATLFEPRHHEHLLCFRKNPCARAVAVHPCLHHIVRYVSAACVRARAAVGGPRSARIDDGNRFDDYAIHHRTVDRPAHLRTAIGSLWAAPGAIGGIGVVCDSQCRGRLRAVVEVA